MTATSEHTPTPAKASATVVLVRDGKQHLEALMVKKNSNITFGGSWVFPGGMIETADVVTIADTSRETAKRAACRETFEETSIKLNENKLYPVSHWVTPPQLAKRYSTWFFIANANHIKQTVSIDKQEIVDFRWLSSARALELHASKQIKLSAPSFVTLHGLEKFTSSVDAIRHYQNIDPHQYLPRGFASEQGFITLFQEDCGYSLPDAEALQAQGLKHRTIMHKDSPWEYIRET